MQLTPVINFRILQLFISSVYKDTDACYVHIAQIGLYFRGFFFLPLYIYNYIHI